MYDRLTQYQSPLELVNQNMSKETGTTSQKVFKDSNRLIDVVIIRSFAIVLVVAFHAYYMMMVEGHFPKSMDLYRGMYFNINCLILQFRMPLFILISGYLFSHLENAKGKYPTLKALVSNKFKRLIIPLLVFATIFMVTTNDFNWRPYYSWGYQHLWFVSMLFWCFVFTRVQSFIPISKTWYWKLSILVVFFYFCVNPPANYPAFGLQYLFGWYFWFYSGYQLYLNRNAIYNFFNKHQIVYSIILAAVFACCCWFKCTVLQNDNIKTWYTEIGNISIVLLLWFWINNALINNTLQEGGGSPRMAKQTQLWHICVS